MACHRARSDSEKLSECLVVGGLRGAYRLLVGAVVSQVSTVSMPDSIVHKGN